LTGFEFVIPGLILGYASSQSRFCLNSGIVDAVFKADFRKVNILLVAVLLQAAFGYAFAGAMPMLGAYNLMVIFSGAFLFGLLLPLSGGCPGGIVFKATEGQTPAIFSLAGFLLAMGVAYISPARSLFKALQTFHPTADLRVSGTGVWILSGFALSLLLYILLKTKDAKPEGAQWSWKKSGILSAWQGRISAELWFVSAVIVGALAAALAARRFAFTRCAPGLCLKRLAAGFGLGLAAAIAGGCSIGYGLAFLPLLSLHAMTAMTAIILGRISAEFLKRRGFYIKNQKLISERAT